MSDTTRFEAWVAAGVVHEALRFALEAYEARGRREPGACFVRLRKLATELDARGAVDDATWTRIEAILSAARVPIDERVRALREPRWARVGVVAFPVVLEGLEPPTGALRWIEARLEPDRIGDPDDPRLVDVGTREALRNARHTLTRVLPDADTLARRAQLRVLPDLASNERIRGGSLAAAAFVALASLHLRREVTPTHVVTGELSGSYLRPVDERTLSTKRAAAAAWPRVTCLVAPGHPTLREGSLIQIGDVDRPEELLTLFGLRWWSHVTRDRLRWIDRSWREAQNVESWFLDLVEKNARTTDTSPRRIEPERWSWLVARLGVALDEWRDRFVAGVRAEGLCGADSSVEEERALEALGDSPSLERGKELPLLAELRSRATEPRAHRDRATSRVPRTTARGVERAIRQRCHAERLERGFMEVLRVGERSRMIGNRHALQTGSVTD